MRLPSPWLLLVVLLLALLVLREPRFADAEENFLNWMVKHSEARGPAVPFSVVEIGADPLTAPAGGVPAKKEGTGSGTPSPLEYALFLQSLLDFQPDVVAFESVLKWRERDKDQEQVFLDQAMRVPKLLLASELGANIDPDLPWAEIHGFTQVTGKRGELAAYSGVVREPAEDLRLISTAGFVNLPADISSEIRVPLLFLYRGEVIPSFPLQAVLLWLKVTPADVKIVLGSHIELPQNRRIPIRADGTMLINPTASHRVRRLTLNELLLAAQQHETGKSVELANLKGEIVLARTPANLLSPPDMFAATIATILGKSYLRRISPIFDCAILLVIAAAFGFLRRIERIDLLLFGIAISAAYCLIALGTLSRWNVWLPGILPLGALWIAIVAALLFPARKEATHSTAIGLPPPII